MAVKTKQILEVAIDILNEEYGCPTVEHVAKNCDNDCKECWKQYLIELVENNNED